MLRTIFVLVGCVLLAGCGGSNVVPVSGTLSYKGKPVTNAFINFVPQSGRPSNGETDANGRFTLVYDPETKGAQIGKHRVFVKHNAVADATQPGAVPGQAPTPVLHTRYADSAPGGARLLTGLA